METVNRQKLKNIIFDYGNVIFEIDFKRAQQAFFELGIRNVEEFFAHKGHHQLFNDFETGHMSSAAFRDAIRAAAGNPNIADAIIDDAWNSLLVGVPGPQVHDTLLEVKTKYRTFLLSNTNDIHYKQILEHLMTSFHVPDNNHLFEKAYYSQQMLLRKPDVAIFERVLKENDLDPQETLFIDDSPQHIEGAKKAGLHTLLMDRKPRYLREFLVEHGIL